jgi:hypothetical protein
MSRLRRAPARPRRPARPPTPGQVAELETLRAELRERYDWFWGKGGSADTVGRACHQEDVA